MSCTHDRNDESIAEEDKFDRCGFRYQILDIVFALVVELHYKLHFCVYKMYMFVPWLGILYCPTLVLTCQESAKRKVVSILYNNERMKHPYVIAFNKAYR